MVVRGALESAGIPVILSYESVGPVIGLTVDGIGRVEVRVPTEWELSKICSAYNAFIDADALGLGAMANASFFMHFPLKEKYPQPWAAREQLVNRGYLTDDGKVNFAGRDFIIFYVGDWDAASWVYQCLPGIWDHPDRGKVPLMWCISPVLDRRAPMVLDYLRRKRWHPVFLLLPLTPLLCLKFVAMQHYTLIRLILTNWLR